MCSHADLAALPPNCPLGHMSLRTSHPSCCMDHVPVRAEPPASPLYGPQHTQAAARQCSHHVLLSLEVQTMETSTVAKCRGSTTDFFPVSRVELQKEGLDVLHHSDMQALYTCMGIVLFSGLHRRGGFQLYCLRRFQRVICHGLGPITWGQ